VDKVLYVWRRTGRLYGEASEGLSIIDASGEEKLFPGITDLKDLEELTE
jgi:hypothetical protein